MKTREVLEQIAHGSNLTDSILVPLMETHKYDVTTCVEALLDLIHAEGPNNIEQEQAELEEEWEFYEECKKEAAQRRPPPPPPEVISEELRRREELEEEMRQKESEERLQFAQMREDLESEWLQRLEEQKRELAAKQEALEQERQKTLNKQLQAVAEKRSTDFKDQVEKALKLRLEEERREAAKRRTEQESNQPEREEEKAKKKAENAISVELTCPETAEMGSKITVFWEYKSGRPSLSDWIGYYKKSRSETSKRYYTYQKTGGQEKGKLEFVVPSKLGICEVRMFQNNSYGIIGRSRPIRVGNSVRVEIEPVTDTGILNVKCVYDDRKKQHSSWDWLAIFEEGSANNKAYLNGISKYVTKEVVSFKAPKKPGRYVVRYFQSGSGYSELAESAAFVVEDNDWIKVRTNPKDIKRNSLIEVEWNIESVNPSSKDKVCMFRKGEFNPLLPLTYQLTHSNKPTGVLKFNLSQGLASGSFEFVFMAHGSSSVVKKSEPFDLN